ncbi:MAG: DUF58 domain-containing protein [Gemmatimonadetes bacterium]|nr:DUF58 domain-containing protein [Gemmatimonadota bacterium]
MSGRRHLLSPEAVARLANLDLIAHHVVEGFFAGLHRSPYHGFSSEFSQHRPYSPGDDLRKIDWGVWGRTDRLFVKQFEEETNLNAMILLDLSHSMAYPGKGGNAGGGIDKSFYSRALAASLTHLLLRQRDAVGLMLFSDRVVRIVAPSSRSSHRRVLLTLLEGAEPHARRTDVPGALHRAAERMRRRGLVILLSDLQACDATSVEHGLRHLRHRGHAVLAIRVLHPSELELDLSGDVILKDLETGRVVATHGIEARRAIRARQAERTRQWISLFGAAGADFSTLTTDQPFDLALGALLRRRVRSGP